jgi:hypothetical protein
MAGTSSAWRGIGLVVLTVAVMNCGYRAMYWYTASTSPQTDVHFALSKAHFWLTVLALAGLAWLYLMWHVIVDDRPTPKSGKK